MKILALNGGLGNQLFQYAYANFILRNNESLYFDITDIIINNQHDGYIIDKFFNKKHKKINFSIFGNRLSFIIRRIFIKISGIEVWSESAKSFIDSVNHAYIFGYWQNKNYINAELISKIRGEIRCHIKNKYDLNFNVDYEVIAVHIRRGDYLMDRDANLYHGVLGIDYYVNAINFMRGKFNKPIFYFFGHIDQDIIDMAHDLNLIFKIIENDSIVDFSIMANCNGIIMANSTFSLWAAYCANSDTVVVAPKRWISNDFNCENIYLSSWELI